MTAIDRIAEEMARQDEIYGDHRWVPDYLWLAILTEEVGEVARCLQERRDPTDELAQVGAVAASWIDSVTR